MIPYAVTFIFSYILVYLAQKYSSDLGKNYFSKGCLVGAICIVSFLAAVRKDTIGSDVLTYVNKYFFQARNNANFISYMSVYPEEYVEVLYKALNYIVARFTGNVRVLYFIIEFIDVGFVMSFLWENRKKASVLMGFFVFTMMFYNISYNIVRQTMAVCICLYSFNAARDEKVKKFLFLILTATLIHRSAIIMVLTYPLIWFFKKKSIPKLNTFIFILTIITTMILLCINAILSVLINWGLLPVKFLHYIGNSFTIYRLSAFVFLMPVILILILYHRTYYRADKLNACMVFYIVIWPVVAQLDGVSDQFGRLAYFFMIANIYLFSQLPYFINTGARRLNIRIVTTASILFMAVYWFLNFYIWKVGETVPYIFGTF